MLDKASEDVLTILLSLHSKNKTFKIPVGYDSFPEGYQNGLSQLFDTLQQNGLIFSYIPFLRGSFLVTLFPSALTYFEEKESTLKRKLEDNMMHNINIQSFTATGSNINFGTITNSSFSAENIVSELEKQIKEQGGEDAIELEDLLKEVKELCEGIKVNSLLPKQTNLMNKISKHLEKHGWFYGAVVQLLGTAMMTAMM